MTFKEFLLWLEAKPLPQLARLPAKEPEIRLANQPQQKSDVTAAPEIRLARGWTDENSIKDILRRMIGPVKDAPGGQGGFADTSAKIDAYLTNQHTGQTVSLQIKARQNGNDVIFEAIKDINLFTRNIDINQLTSAIASGMPGAGRDMRTKAEAYAVMDATKSFIQIVSAENAKEIGTEMIKIWHKMGQPRDINSPYGRVHVQQGDSHNMKLICFIRPGAIAKLPGFPPVAVPK